MICLKFHFVVPIFIIILLSFLCADFVYQKYQENYISGGNIYFLQQGVYTNLDSIKNIAASYITVERDQKFYTYLGMTMDLDIALKIKEFYEKKNIPVYIKQDVINNPEFLSELGQYDILLQNSESEEEISNVLETILSTYEETLKME